MPVSKIRKVLIAVLAVVLIVSGGFAIKTALDYRLEAEIYQIAQETYVSVAPTVSVTTPAVTPETTTTDATPEVEEIPFIPSLVPGITVDFDSLMGVNSDVIGWLHFEGMAISYPLVQGDDNQTYVSTAYDGRYSAAGSIFADYRVNSDFTSQNTVLYGHNMKSDTMFGELQDYRTSSFITDHPYFFILTPQGYLRYEVCYALLADASSTVYDYEFAAESDFAAHLSTLAKRSLYATGVEVTSSDKIVTLSTCTGYTESERFVLVGRLAEQVYT